RRAIRSSGSETESLIDICQLPTPNSPRPTTSHSQLPIERCWELGIGIWEWLEVGNWELGIDKRPVYIELHAASAFSFLQGASLPEALVERAAALGYPAIALLDADGVYGAPRFHKAAKQAGLKAIIGAELTIGAQSPEPKAQSQYWRLPVLVSSAEGDQDLCP